MRTKIAIGIAAAVATYWLLFKRSASAAAVPAAKGEVLTPGYGLPLSDPDFSVKHVATPPPADVFTEAGRRDPVSGELLYGPGF